MARPKTSRPTDVELQILNVLWRHGPLTIRQIHDFLAKYRKTGYSTTLKMVQVMREKGLVTRDDSVRPQIYSPAKSQKETQANVLRDIASRLFDGSASQVVMCMVADKEVPESELEQIEQFLAEARRKKIETEAED